MKKHAYGFTIVELLIIIVVIGILAAITVVVFNGVQTRAYNTTRYSELKDWQRIFELYKVAHGTYPSVADGGYCLGYGFPIGNGGVARCRDYTSVGSYGYLESDNATLMTELKKAASTLPSGLRKPSKTDGTVGPYTIYTSTHVHIYAAMSGKDSSVCPPGTSMTWTDNANTVLCRISMERS